MNRLVASVVAGMMGLAGVRAGRRRLRKRSRRGDTVSAVSGDSLTVTVKDHPMKFVVDGTTDVVAPGGGTMARAAKAEGKKGVAITSVVKVGQTVEVKYHQPAMHAAIVRVIGAGAPAVRATSRPRRPSREPATQGEVGHAAGQVTAMTGTSLTSRPRPVRRPTRSTRRPG